MSGSDLICPKCNLTLASGTQYCPNDHAVTGGVRGIPKDAIERTPNSKRHLLGVTVSDAYVINGYLGSGGFGAVYRAEQKALGRDIALKLLMLDAVGDDVVIKRFKREARTAAALLDPNIVTLFDYGEASLGPSEEDRVLYITMELVHGPTLRQVLKRTKGLPLDVALQIGINILRGLAAAHQLGVVHRDLKPGNVLMDESKNREHFARLFDFGIASLQGSGGHTTQMGQGGVLGTPKYMAPEQWRAQQTAPCTDIYAFGTMFAEMLLGHAPIPKMDLVDMAAAHCRDPRPTVTETATGDAVPAALTNFIKKCMAIDPRQRYGTAREALDALEIIDRDREQAPVPAVTRDNDPGIRDPDELSMPSGAFAAPNPTPPGMRPPPPPPDAFTDDVEILEVKIEEPRRIWPWILGLIGIALLFVGVKLLAALTPGELVVPDTGMQTAVAPIVDIVDATRGAPDAAVLDAVVPDAAPDAAVPDAAPDISPEDAAKVVVSAAKPKPRAVRKPNPKSVEKPVARPEPPKPAKIAGIDTTPKANPTPADVAAAEAQYRRGLDAQKRGAPKSAQRFFASALRKGLRGPNATDAQRRIKRIADRTALEASEF